MKTHILLASLTAALFATVSFADDAQTLTVQNVTLQPGDVIDFVGGGGSEVVAGDTYGHTGMYLGLDPDTNQRVFLDFTTSKGRDKYYGRISNAETFFSDNLEHGEFDVFRPNSDYAVDQDVLMSTAKEQARTGSWGAPRDCANAVSETLSKASPNLNVHAIRPDLYAEDSHFSRANAARVNIAAALGEAKGEPDDGAINGTWSGQVSQNDMDHSFSITLNIQNVTSGTAEIAGQCEGSLSGGSRGQGTYVYGLSITSGDCIPGTVTLVLGSPGIVHYSWSGYYDGKSISSSAVLTKQ